MGKFFRAFSWVVLLSFVLNVFSQSNLYAASQIESMLESRIGGKAAEFSAGPSLGINIKVNVLGGVRLPGIYEIPESTDILTLLGYTGGGNEFANLDDVSIKRRKGDGYEILKVDVERLVTSNEKKTPYLQSGDVIFVSESKKTQNLTTVLSIVASILGIGMASYTIIKLSQTPSGK